jgi:hypothetical protein
LSLFPVRPLPSHLPVEVTHRRLSSLPVSSLCMMVLSHLKDALLGSRETQLLAYSRPYPLAHRITNASNCSTRPPLEVTLIQAPARTPSAPCLPSVLPAPKQHMTRPTIPAQASLLEELAKRGYSEPLPPLLDTPASLFTSDGLEQLEQAAASAATVNHSLPLFLPPSLLPH